MDAARLDVDLHQLELRFAGARLIEPQAVEKLACSIGGSSIKRHGECARLLLDAGAQVNQASLPTEHDAVDRVLREHLVRG